MSAVRYGSHRTRSMAVCSASAGINPRVVHACSISSDHSETSSDSSYCHEPHHDGKVAFSAFDASPRTRVQPTPRLVVFHTDYAPLVRHLLPFALFRIKLSSCKDARLCLNLKRRKDSLAEMWSISMTLTINHGELILKFGSSSR